MASRAARIDRRGRIVVPAEYRRALGLHPGDEVTLILADGEVRIVTRAEAIRRAQELVAWRSRRRSLVDELIAERRGEAVGD